ncbi:hypothetical protein CANCADRAFT_73015 [Tortispora caseinolytica NRRL Y-17796]|uniref:CUE domain-containing protein n=1 Tax=Tortispora caseinolytica NRRL Y-17796 TaxID=767744 RepID=A0A1E4TIL9_9ASCO|nr:hypothetical protein CANCADRAFT_73015 [Tortispora caseinolytica NRRL Y-17796]
MGDKNEETPDLKKTLKDAFPDAPDEVVRAVAIACQGSQEWGFYGMLAYGDKNFVAPAPPVDTAKDEEIARQLAEQYGGQGGRPRVPRPHRGGPPRGPAPTGTVNAATKERSFLDDDLPEIRENLTKGFKDTRTKVNTWVENLRKKLDGEEDDSSQYDSYGSRRYGQGQGRPARRRRGGYDDDHRMLDDDFDRLAMRDDFEDNDDVPPPRPPRPASEEKGDVSVSGGVTATTSSSTPKLEASKKSWEPLNVVAPEPEDAFLIEEDDDKEDEKVDDKTKTGKSEHDDQID